MKLVFKIGNKTEKKQIRYSKPKQLPEKSKLVNEKRTLNISSNNRYLKIEIKIKYPVNKIKIENIKKPVTGTEIFHFGFKP